MLVTLLRAHTKNRAIGSLEVLDRLIKLYLCEDYDDAPGFLWLGMEARKIVRGIGIFSV
jgi:hypothetical protein